MVQINNAFPMENIICSAAWTDARCHGRDALHFRLDIDQNRVCAELSLCRLAEKAQAGSSRLRGSLFAMFRPPLLRTTLIASLIATSVLFAYWGLFTWVPTFLSTSIDKGGAGMGIVKSSGWVIMMQIGSFFGYISFGFLADRFGRKPTFIGFLASAVILVPLYGQLGSYQRH